MKRTFRKRNRIAFAAIGIVGSLLLASPIHAQPIDGVGKLKFGMKPDEVAALDGCSSQTECLYEILGKNRYFRLVYRPEHPDPKTPPSQTPPGTLSLIDIDMGNYTRTWFLELIDVLASQFPVIHSPTETGRRDVPARKKSRTDYWSCRRCCLVEDRPSSLRQSHSPSDLSGCRQSQSSAGTLERFPYLLATLRKRCFPDAASSCLDSRY